MKTNKKMNVFFLLLYIFFLNSEYCFSQNVLTYFPETNGKVNAIVTKGDTAYIGGDFTTVGGLNRNHLAAIFIKTGVVLNWDPNADQSVTSLAINGNVIYVGGFIAKIGGQDRTAIAAIDAITGVVMNWNPIITYQTFYRTVQTIAYGNNKLFISGGFDNINGSILKKLNKALLDATTGQLITDFTLNGNIYTTQTTNTTLYVGGDFDTIDTQSRPFLGAINLATNIVNNWSPNPNNRINKLLLNKGKLYMGGKFNIIGASFKNGLACIDTSYGLPASWNPLANGSSVTDMAITSDAIYVTGYGNPLVSYDLTNGIQKDYWASGGVLASYGDTVIVGGSFTKVGWVNRNYLFAVTKGLSLGVNEIENRFRKINVYPNPTSKSISFSLNERGTILISNILGIKVLEQEISKNNEEQKIDISELASGIYTLKIITEDKIYSNKFLKD